MRQGDSSPFLRTRLAAAACWLCLCAPALADGLLIITHPAVTISREDVRDVFLGEKQIANGVKLVPIDNASAQSTFLALVMKLEPAKYERMVFGLILVLMMIFRPQGILPARRRRRELENGPPAGA